jgi:uncharacterized protein
MTAPHSTSLSKSLSAMVNTALSRLMILIARGWQLGPSRILPPSCRYAPSCSAYAITAIERHGAIKGGWMAFKRVLRCNPWGGHGYDPVPCTHKDPDPLSSDQA